MERRLGRGLGSLLGGSDPVEPMKGAQELDIARVRPNPHQPRKTFDPQALEELTQSIRQHGVLQPIVVRPSGSSFEIVSGERRWRASQAAGRLTIPATVRADIRDDQMLELALVENLQRQDLDAMERAHGYRDMMETLQVTQEQVAEKVGLKRATVANHLRLLELPVQAQDAVRKGLISMGHARALIGIPKQERILSLVERIAREDLSVREVERIVREQAKPVSSAPAASAAAHPVLPWVRELEERMREHLGTKAKLQVGPGYRGQIVVEFYNRADLDRLAGLLAPKDELR